MLNNKLGLKELPAHVAFIIDGNGRWALKRGMPRSFGHKVGVKSCKNVINSCYNLGIKYVSIFGFSTENWNRPKDEIDGLFNLLREFVKNDLQEWLKNDIKVVVSGDYSVFPKDLVTKIEEVLTKTKNNKGMVLNLCINYGGRQEIIRAVNCIIKSGVKKVNEKHILKHLYTADLPSPDFIIRTSGEQRLSNFMLWQCSYAELYFPKTYWPDFNKKHLIKAFKVFNKRKRRYGAIEESL